jgi:hypothetical protein
VDPCSIRPGPNCCEVRGDLHGANVTNARAPSTPRPNDTSY